MFELIDVVDFVSRLQNQTYFNPIILKHGFVVYQHNSKSIEVKYDDELRLKTITFSEEKLQTERESIFGLSYSISPIIIAMNISHYEGSNGTHYNIGITSSIPTNEDESFSYFVGNNGEYKYSDSRGNYWESDFKTPFFFEDIYDLFSRFLETIDFLISSLRLTLTPYYISKSVYQDIALRLDGLLMGGDYNDDGISLDMRRNTHYMVEAIKNNIIRC